MRPKETRNSKRWTVSPEEFARLERERKLHRLGLPQIETAFENAITRIMIELMADAYPDKTAIVTCRPLPWLTSTAQPPATIFDLGRLAGWPRIDVHPEPVEGAAGTYEGGFLWQPSVILGKPDTFLGYPIHTQDDMGTLAGTEGVIAAFGNFKAGYRILDHTGGMTVQRLVELYAEAGLIGFKVHKRVGGYCIRPANKSIILLTEHV